MDEHVTISLVWRQQLLAVGFAVSFTSSTIHAGAVALVRPTQLKWRVITEDELDAEHLQSLCGH